MRNNSNSSRVRESFADAVNPVDQQVNRQDTCQPACWHTKHPAHQQDCQEGGLRDASCAEGQDSKDQDGHHNLVRSHLGAFQPGDIEEANDGVAGQVDEHPNGEDETGNIWLDPIFDCQTLEGDRKAINGGGSAKVEEKCQKINRVLKSSFLTSLKNQCLSHAS